MKKMMFVVVMMMFACASFGVEVSEKLLRAIAQVESKGNDKAKGDYSKKTKEYRAIGKYQLWKIYIDDVNEFSKKKFTYNDRWNAEKSKEIVIIYLKHYGRNYERKTGKKATNEVLSRIHNGGPKGWQKKATIKYWNKVRKELMK